MNHCMSEDPEKCVAALRALSARSALAMLGDALVDAVGSRLIEEIEWDLRLHDLGIDFELLRLFDPA